MRKINLIILLVLCFATVLCLSSCETVEGILGNLGITESDPCKDGHSYSDEWKMDDSKHWHEATCEHTDLRADEAEHVYVDGACICGKEIALDHDHTYSSTWSSDDSKHWHAATCEHTDLRADEAEHVYVDGACICGKVAPHEHTFEDEWSYNDAVHWHAATCSHTDMKSDLAAHSYAGGVCICGMIEPEASHTHTFDTEWSSDAHKHWHAATCEHTGFRMDEGAHSYNESFVCTACGYTHEHTYSSAWSSDGSKHWHTATCGHDVRADEADHVYADGACICGKEDPELSHEHTFASEWSYNDTHHWHAATCGHDVKADLSEHFIGGDNACVGNCGYKYEAPHIHSFSSKWSYDESKHWHRATCEHTEEVSDEEAHTYGADGVCEVCGCAAPIVISASDIAQGGWAYGNTKENSKRIRVNRLIPIKAGTVIKYDMNGFELYLDLADGEGSTTGDRVGWFTGSGEYLVQRDAYLGITIAASGRSTAISPSQFNSSITIIPGTGEIEMTYEKVNVYKFGGEGNDWCFVYLPEDYDPDRAEPYPFVIANHGNGWNMDGSARKANWTDNTMYMSAAEIATQPASRQARFIATEDPDLWYSNATIEALLDAGYIVCGAQNYGDNLYGNDDCTNAVVDFFNHMTETYNVESSCHMIGASNGAMTTLNAAEKLGNKVRSVIIQYPLASIITHYLAGGHQDSIEAAYGLDTSKTYTKAELEAALSEYDVLYKNVVDGIKQGYYPAVKVYYSMTDTLTTAAANAIPLINMLEKSGKEVVGVPVDADGTSRQHGDAAHFDPEGYVAWFNAH